MVLERDAGIKVNCSSLFVNAFLLKKITSIVKQLNHEWLKRNADFYLETVSKVRETLLILGEFPKTDSYC